MVIMKKYKIGETFQLNGIDLLVLDYVGENPFVLAYNLDIQTKFSDNSNDYRRSLLQEACERWFNSANIPVIQRSVDLRAINGDTDYGAIKVKAAPLTFDEWRNYQKIITPVIKNWAWTVTPWADYNISTFVCFVSTGGVASYYDYDYSLGLAPAFILDGSFTTISAI